MNLSIKPLVLVASVTMTAAVIVVMSSLLFGFRNEFIGKTVNSTAHARILGGLLLAAAFGI